MQPLAPTLHYTVISWPQDSQHNKEETVLKHELSKDSYRTEYKGDTMSITASKKNMQKNLPNKTEILLRHYRTTLHNQLWVNTDFT